jgi:hypothetical protein
MLKKEVTKVDEFYHLKKMEQSDTITLGASNLSSF